MYVSDDQRNWDAHLPFVMFAYRTSMNETTGESPFYLFYGRHARLPAQVVHGDGSSTGGKLDYVQDMTRPLTEAGRRVQENIIRKPENDGNGSLQTFVRSRIKWGTSYGCTSHNKKSWSISKVADALVWSVRSCKKG